MQNRAKICKMRIPLAVKMGGFFTVFLCFLLYHIAVRTARRNCKIIRLAKASRKGYTADLSSGSFPVLRLTAPPCCEAHTQAVKELIARYGAERLSDIAERDYAPLLEEAEELVCGKFR